MTKAKKQEPDYTAELQQDFDRWDYLHIHGGSDPLWSDGSNMNLVRNHILIGKRRIEENMIPEQYPDIYYRKTPPKMDKDYMARPDEIRENAKTSLEIYKANEDYQYLRRRITRLTERQKKDTCIAAVIGYAEGLEQAINNDDLITMRRHEHPNNYVGSFSSCAARVRDIRPPDTEQISLFVDYSDDYEEDWGCEH